jgi:hypothetical protein
MYDGNFGVARFPDFSSLSKLEMTNVDIFQCSCGTTATSRCPRGARPYRRVTLVLAQVSSMRTSRSGSKCGWAARPSRAAATSGRCCSAA